jgi:hypothetical protein
VQGQEEKVGEPSLCRKKIRARVEKKILDFKTHRTFHIRRFGSRVDNPYYFFFPGSGNHFVVDIKIQPLHVRLFCLGKFVSTEKKIAKIKMKIGYFVKLLQILEKNPNTPKTILRKK